MMDEMFEGKAKVEPDAETRAGAKRAWAVYTALTDEGFTDSQALQIIGYMMMSP